MNIFDHGPRLFELVQHLTTEEWQNILAADADEASNIAPLDRAAGEE